MIRVAALHTKAVGTKYLSERERDPEREGDASRRLFNQERDDLTHSQADHILTGLDAVKRPHPDDLYHLIFSPQEVQDYERLGDDPRERSAALKDCARDAMNVFERELNVRDVRWVAAAHLNTDNPHVHVLINRNMTDERTGMPWRLDHVPREFLMHRQGVPVKDDTSANRDEAAQEASEPANQPRNLIPNTSQELVRFDGRLGESFADGLRARTLPLRQIAFRVDHSEEFTRREVIDPRSAHRPTPEEITVGKWIVAEVRNGADETTRQLQERHDLRLAVERLDARGAIARESKTRAYLPEETWRELIRENKIQALCQDGTLPPRYHRAQEIKAGPGIRFEELRPQHGGMIVGLRAHDSGRLMAREVIPINPDPKVKPAPEVDLVRPAVTQTASARDDEKAPGAPPSDGKVKTRLEHVTPERPCPVCRRPDNCATTLDGTRGYCRRVETAEDERGQRLDYAKLKEGRDGGWWVDLTKLPDYAPRDKKQPQNEVIKYPLAPVEKRDVVYRAMLDKLDLIKRDRDDLDRRGILEGANQRADYRTVPGKLYATRIARELSEEGHDLKGIPGFWREDEPGKQYASEGERWRLNLNHWYRGYMIPVKDQLGRIEGFQIRRREPKTFTNPATGKEEKEPKYVWLSSDNTEKKPRPEGTSPGSPIHFVNVERIRESGHAIITEGNLKGDITAWYLDHGVITRQGVGNFPSDLGHRLRELIPELRKVSVADDADLVHNKAVAKQSNRLQKSLEAAGLEVGILRWEERHGKGSDDYLQNSLGADFHERVADPVIRSALRKAVLKEIGYAEPTRLVPGMRDLTTGRIVKGEECAVAEWMRHEVSQKDQPNAPKLALHRMNVRALDAVQADRGLPVHPAVMHASEIDEALSSGKLLTHEQLVSGQRNEDRLRLGDEFRARLELKHANWRLQQAREFGDITRYTVRDDSTRLRRPMSFDDVSQRGTIRAYQATDDGQEQIDSAEKSERHALRRQIFDDRKDSDEKNHQATISAIRAEHSKQINGLERALDSAHRAHDEARPVAFQIERSYRAANEPVPVPILDRATVDRLHEEAYERRDTEAVKDIDALRHKLSAEQGAPAHTEESARRLAAQSRMTTIDAEAARRREDRFRENAHNRLWKVDGEEKEWSLAGVDREIARCGREHDDHMGRADFFGPHGFVANFFQGKAQGLNPLNSLRLSALNPLNPVLNEPAIKAARFGLDLYRWSVQAREAGELAAEALARQTHLETNVRPGVVDQIKEHARGLGEQTGAARECADTLRQMHETEAGERAARGTDAARPWYKEPELRRMESTAGALRDPELLGKYEAAVQEGLSLQVKELRELVGSGKSPEEAARTVVENRIRDSMRELPVTDKQSYTIERALGEGKTFADGSTEKPAPANRMEASEHIEELTGKPAVWRTEAEKAVEEMVAGGKALTPEAVEARLRGDLAGRAAGRQILAEARTDQAEATLQRSMEHRETTAVAYRDEAGELRTASLRDVEPQSNLDLVSRFFDGTDREVHAREMVRQQLDVREMDLSTEVDAAEEWQTATREIADSYRSEVGLDAALPRFTAREAAELERLGGGLTPEEVDEIKALPELTEIQQQQIYYSQTVQEALADERVGYIELPQPQPQPETNVRSEGVEVPQATGPTQVQEEVTGQVTFNHEAEEEMARIAGDKLEERSTPEINVDTEELDEHVAELRGAGENGTVGPLQQQRSVQEIVEEMIQEETAIEEAGLELGL